MHLITRSNQIFAEKMYIPNFVSLRERKSL